MNYLRCKIPDYSSTHGLIKVYFCCHPDDQTMYFDTIVEEIFQFCKCAVYYDDCGNERDDEFLSHLKDMRLFIMPVTQKLLTVPNYALDREFAFAKERKIPVLPLMQEIGLDNIFNKKCGAIQYLDKMAEKNPQDYLKKLKKFLSSISSGADMSENIRSAFDAHIFLSYRKKDRAYARELMSLIHESDKLSGIAIWYDDYLIPGENYNDTIKEAIQSCDIFVMAITPNMVNELNYVSSCEYPEAVASGKTIVPCEIIKTDKAGLDKTFCGISDTVDAYNKEEMVNRFLSELKKLNITIRERTPERDYLIGLAYLEGIDIESDSQKALRLIRSSADRGYPEAMAKLAEMYLNGVGVEKDKKAAIKWAKAYVEMTGKLLTDINDHVARERYFKALFSNIELFFNANKILSGISYILKMGKEAKRLNYEESLYYASFCYFISLPLLLFKNDKYLLKAIEILENIPLTVESLELLGEAYHSKLYLINKYKNTDQYIDFAKKAINSIKSYSENNENIYFSSKVLKPFYDEISLSFSFLKKIKQEKIDIDIKVAKIIDENIGDDDSKRALAKCYYNIGQNILTRSIFSDNYTEQRNQIINYTLSALDLCKLLVNQTQLISDYEFLIEILYHLKSLYPNDTTEHDFYYNELIEKIETVGINKFSSQCKVWIASFYHSIAYDYEKKSDQILDGYYNTSKMINDVFSGEFDRSMDDVDKMRELSISYYLKEISLLEEIIRKEKNSEYYLSNLLSAYCDIVTKKWADIDRNEYIKKAEEVASRMSEEEFKRNSFHLKHMYEILAIDATDDKKRKEYKKLAKKY